MVTITGGVGAVGTADAGQAERALRAATAEPATPEERIADALLDCIARWGLAKTTVGDVARAAGVSRATVYRLFPGGKDQILDAGARAAAARLADLLAAELGDEADLRAKVVGALHLSAEFLDRHEALTFLRQNEPVAVKQALAFDHLDALLDVVGPLFAPLFEPYLDPAEAGELGVWLARLIVSHLATPTGPVDLRSADAVAALVDSFILPGLTVGDPSLPPTTRRP